MMHGTTNIMCVLVLRTAFLSSAQLLLYNFPLKMNSGLYFLKQADRSKLDYTTFFHSNDPSQRIVMESVNVRYADVS